MKAILAAAVALAGCTAADQAPPAENLPAACDAAAVQDLIGKPLGAHEAEAKQRAGARVVRSYPSGSALTMDFRPDRLNIETDTAGAIVKLSCG